MTEDWQNGGFGLYIHWPFCQAKCPYCDFNSHVAATIDQSRWQAAYLSEIRRLAALTPGRVLNSVFFGGGTPSLMDPDVVHAIMDEVRACWPTANDLETTLEANPSSVEAGRFRGYAQAGVNRVSMGFQALNNDDLRRLGRLHTVEEAFAAYDTARAHFDRVSFDLIYARQDQTPDAWRAELSKALSMGIDHLSAYQLTIEAGTAFGDRYDRGKLRGLPDDDTAADMYFITQELCERAGLPAYEVSNHAKPGAESKHNLNYWRYGDYGGIGPGAHGRLTLNGTRMATETPLFPTKWLEMVENSAFSDFKTIAIEPTEQAAEYLMMGLRKSTGVSQNRFASIGGAPLNANVINDLRDLDLIALDQDRLRATPKGIAVLNAVIRELLPDG